MYCRKEIFRLFSVQFYMSHNCTEEEKRRDEMKWRREEEKWRTSFRLKWSSEFILLRPFLRIFSQIISIRKSSWRVKSEEWKEDKSKDKGRRTMGREEKRMIFWIYPTSTLFTDIQEIISFHFSKSRWRKKWVKEEEK